tara:strand:- start:188 stop:379 length:192 start_codon:yes stop_codon:yes gene_type:complete
MKSTNKKKPVQTLQNLSKLLRTCLYGMRVYGVSRLTQIQQTDLVSSRLETMVSKFTLSRSSSP